MTTTLLKLSWQRDWLERRASQWGAERQLDAMAYLKEQWQWSSVRLYQEYLCQMIFHHAAATSKHGHKHAVCWGRQEPSAESGMEGESAMIQLTRPDSSWEDIADLYCDVYQLRRLPGRMLCDKETEACICQEILDSVKEHLWHKWLSTLLGEELRWTPASIHRLNPQANFQARNHAIFDRFMNARQDSCDEALAVAGDAH